MIIESAVSFIFFRDHEKFQSCDQSQTSNHDHDKHGLCIVIMGPCPVYKANSLPCAEMDKSLSQLFKLPAVFLKFASQWLLITAHRADKFSIYFWGNIQAGGGHSSN